MATTDGKYEPEMRTRFAGQLMSILSFSLQGDTTERITAWEREIATYEQDSGKVLDDEVEIGTFLLKLSESQLKTHLLMRVETMKKWTDFTGKLVAVPQAISTAQTQPTPCSSSVGLTRFLRIQKTTVIPQLQYTEEKISDEQDQAR